MGKKLRVAIAHYRKKEVKMATTISSELQSGVARGRFFYVRFVTQDGERNLRIGAYAAKGCCYDAVCMEENGVEVPMAEVFESANRIEAPGICLHLHSEKTSSLLHLAMKSQVKHHVGKTRYQRANQMGAALDVRSAILEDSLEAYSDCEDLMNLAIESAKKEPQSCGKVLKGRKDGKLIVVDVTIT